ncbi:hypothetical protein FRB93_002211 [Tulasnella sp. JGI-2019a]|nr:hypothetical protein FRB93_002211 [Tulasnella sp. JGI-2019a]
MQKPKHYVFVAPPMMGHIRPMTHFACNLLKIHPTLCITFITHIAYLTVIKTESARHSSPELRLDDRLHIISVGKDKRGSDNLDVGSEVYPSFVEIAVDFPTVYASLLRCEVSKFNLAEVPFSTQPSVVLVDSPLVSLVAPSKEEVEKAQGIKIKIPLIIENAIPPMFILRLANFLSETHRLAGDPCREVYANLCSTPGGLHSDQRPQWEEVHDLNAGNGLVKVPGMPETYAYELCPQRSAQQYPPNVLEMLSAVAQSNVDLTSHVFPYDATLDGEAADAFNTLCGRSKEAMYLIGPQFPDEFWSGKRPQGSTLELLKGTTSGKVEGFLDKMQARFGRSVLYISFGSLTFPRETSHLVALFDTLLSISPPIPFLFSRDPRYIKLPDDLYGRLNAKMEEGLALIVEWAPQQTVLQHPAVSFFLSHCGSGSVHEAIVSAVPLILWPIAYDQPYIAAVLTRKHKVAFELLQVRTGINVGRPTAGSGTIVLGTDAAIREEMRSVLTLTRGEDAEALRSNMKVLQRAFKESHDSGTARQAMERFGHIAEELVTRADLGCEASSPSC